VAAQGVRREHSVGFQIGAALSRSFGESFKSVDRQLQATKKSIRDANRAWGDFGARVGKIGLGIVGGITGVAIAAYRMADNIAQSADAVTNSAARLRMSTYDYQKLEYAFTRAGMGADQFSYIMNRMDTSIVKASQSAQGLQRFGLATGLDAEKLARLDTAGRIERIADYLNSLEDPLKRDQVAMELFGRRWAEMSNVLEKGSEGIREAGEEFLRTGGMIDTATIEASRAYNQHKQELTATINGIKVQLFSRLIPYFSEVFKNISANLQNVDWDAWGQKIVTWIDMAVPKVQELAIRISEIAKKVWEGIQVVQEFVGGWKNLAIIVGILLNFKTVMSGVKAVMATGNAIIQVSTLLRTAYTAATVKATAAEMARTKVVLLGAKAAVVAAAKAILLKIAIFAIPLAIAAVVAGIIWMIRNWDTVKEVVGKVVEWISDRWRSFVEWIKGIWNNLFEGMSEETRAFIEGVKEFFKGLISGIIIIFKPIIEFYKMVFGVIIEGVKEFISGFLEIFSGINSFQDLINAIPKVFRLAFDTARNMARSFIEGILRIFSPLTNLVEGIGNTLGGLFGRGRNNSVSVDIPQHALGGIFNKPHIAQIAEKGPEAVVPLENTKHAKSIWEKAGNMAGFFSDRDQEGISAGLAESMAGLFPDRRQEGVSIQPAGSMARFADADRQRGLLPDVPMLTSQQSNINVPIDVSVNVKGSADQDTARSLQDAGSDIARQIKAEIVSILPGALAEIQRGQARRAFI